MAKTKILVVEDENIIAVNIKNKLKGLGYTVAATVPSGEEAIQKVEETHPDLVLMDIKLKGDVDGVQAAEKICSRFNVPVIYLTAYSDDNTLQRAKLSKPFGYLLKPVKERELYTAIEIALYQHKMEEELKKHRDHLEELVEERTAEIAIANEQLKGEIVERKRAEEALQEAHDELEARVKERTKELEQKTQQLQKEITERKRAEEELNRKHNLIESIKNVQSQFIADADPYILFDNILKVILSLTQSEYGFIGEVLYTDDGDPYLKTHAITNIAWNKETKEFYKKNAPIGTEFRNLKTLFGAVITTGKPVISNDPSADPQSGGLPPRHPPLNAFLGLPIYSGKDLVSMIGIANRPNGYDNEIIEYLKPIVSTYGTLIDAFRNIQKRTQTEEALKQSEERFDLAMQGANDGLWDWDLVRDEVYYSPRWKSMLGYNVEEIKPHLDEWKRLLHPDDLDRAISNFQAYIDGKIKVYNIEFNMQHKDGHYVNILSRGMAIRDNKGKAFRIIGTHVDITERKQAEEIIRNSEDKLKRAQKIARFGNWELDLKTDKGLWSEQVYHIFGYKPGEIEISFEWFLKHIHPDDRKHVAIEIRQAVNKQKPIEMEYRVYRKDGGECTVHSIGQVKLDETGKIIGMEGTIQDITKRKRSEEELSKLSNAIQQSADSVIITDKEGVIEFVNPAFEKITGYSKEEVIGKTPGILRSGKHKQKFYEKLWKTVLSGKIFRETIINKKKNGELFWDEKVISPIIDKQGIITHFVATGKDVTKRKQAEEEVYQSREQLRSLAARLQSIREEEQTRISRELHDELGHSLTALKIDLVALSKDPLIKSKPQADDLQSMISLTDHSLQTVKRIATELRPGVLDHLGLGAAIEWQSKEFQSHTQIKCEVRLPEERLGLDKDKDIILFRILQESLTNVARHAQATNIVITLQKDKQSISMIVQDDGRGIEESEVVGMRSLGLLGMRERAHLVGGKLTITGEKGKGTTVSVSVPMD
ncbi:MAG: PAS domain-containing protein [Candidatus Marinimicrobia bacterium]|nr:PAS domain-containing protein [Candidatus Neomarinimicrobiota bacterium]